MWCGRKVHALVVSTGALVCFFCQQSHAGLEIVSQSIHLDKPDQEVDFTLNFNHAPDFQTVDSSGRRADSFQYEIIPNTDRQFSAFSYPNGIVAVIRGNEIGSGNLLPIRNGIENGSDPSPTSGGWGTVRGNVPFSLNGSQLTFAASFNLLGTTSGHFSYDVITTHFGAQVSNIEGVSVPLPPALPGGLCILGGTALVRALRRPTVTK